MAVIGNGAIGTFTAIDIKSTFPNYKVYLIGPSARNFAASTAAGAMANVYAEMEFSTGQISRANEIYLEMGKAGSRKWRDFLGSKSGSHCITSEDTFVYLKRNATEFETKNFNAATSYALKDKVGSLLNKQDATNQLPEKLVLSTAEILKIKGEFSLSVPNLFNFLDGLAKNEGVEICDDLATQISDRGVQLDSGKFIEADKIICAAGVKTSNLFPAEYKVMELLQGVGVAMELTIPKSHTSTKLRNGVIRSVNRGGAQCGIHLVPRNENTFYLGAGNYVSKLTQPEIRLDTLRYLLSTLGNEVVGKEVVYESVGKFVLGLRPRSIDGFPMIGPLSKNSSIFIITGTNRAGLTWAPYLSTQVINWLKNLEIDEVLSEWKPDRKPIIWGEVNEAINYFSNSRISNAFEHDLFQESLIEEKSIEFRKVAENLIRTIQQKYKLKDNEVINPDNWGALTS